MQTPVLYVFLISHYCEKARWALDLCGIKYRVELLSPLKHSKTVKAAGAKRSALPVLKTQAGIIQGSAAIVDWANAHAAEKSNPVLSITPESLEIEQRLDDVLGVHVRRWFYSESLLDCPETVKPVFAKGSGFIERIILSLAWPKVVATMIKRMDLGAQQEAESRAIVEKELDWLDSLLVNETGERNDFLVGSSISNADIAAAGLMAPLFSPNAHPATGIVMLPPRAESTAKEWSTRPFSEWLIKLYKEHR